jgi:hypothetical protein
MPFSDDEVMAGQAGAEAFHSPPSLARSAADWATSAIRGLAHGAIGMVGQAGDIPQLITETGYSLGVPRPPEGGLQAFPTGSPFPTSKEITEKIGGKDEDKNAAGKFLTDEPKTPGGRYVQSVTEFAAPSALGRGRLVAKGLEAIGGGIGSEAAGELFPDHPTLSRIIGGALGSKTPGAARRVVTPFPTSPERQAMVQTLRAEGVEPTAGDVSGRKALKHAESALGDAPFAGGRYGEAREEIGQQFTRAVLRRVGENADRATPDVVDRALTRIGNNFDTLAARNNARLDAPYFNGLFAVQGDYNHLFVDPLRRPIVQDVIDHSINQLIRSPTLTGEQYQALASRLERMRRGYKSDPELANFLGDVRRELDDLMERNIRRNNPQDLGRWQQARREYRNMLTVERAASAAGEDAAMGIISPAQLRAAVVGQGRRGYARGQGDFSMLARAGNAVLKPPSTSNTAERAMLHAVPAGVAGALGQAFGGAPEAAAAIMGGLAAPGYAGRALMSPGLQGYFGNQLLGGAVQPNTIEALAKSFIANQATQGQ